MSSEAEQLQAMRNAIYAVVNALGDALPRTSDLSAALGELVHSDIAFRLENALTGDGTYLPLYAEKRCLVCGFWRGQHPVAGDAANDTDMRCPISDSTFTPDQKPGEQP